MAYKFQFGQAILSGALDQEGDVDILDSGVLKMAGSTAIDASRNATLAQVSGSGEFRMGLSKLKIDNALVTATAAELNLVDGAAADTIVNNKAVIYGGSGEINGTSFDVSGTEVISSGRAATFSSAKVSDLTDNRLVIAGTAGELEDSDKLTFDGADLTLGDTVGAFNLTLGAGTRLVAVDISGSGDLSAASLSGTLEFKLSKAANSGLAMTDFDNTADVSDLAVDLNSLATATINVAADSFAIIDADASNGTRKESIADFVAAIDGSGLLANAGVLGVVVDDSTIEIDSNTVRLKDDGVTGAKLHPDVAGLGLGQDGSGNLDIQVSGAVKIASDKVGITGSFAGPGLEAIGGDDSISAIDLNVSTITTVLTGSSIGGNDQFAVFETGVAQKKATLADIAKALAGDGISADPTTGELSTQAGAMSVFTGAGALSEGYNVQNATTSMTMTLPTGAPGDVVTVKAGALSAGQVLTVARNAGDPKNIEGAAASILLESPRAAVTLVYASDALGWFVV